MCAAYLSDAAGLPPPRLVGRHHAGAPRPPAAVARQHRELGDGHGVLGERHARLLREHLHAPCVTGRHVTGRQIE
jgi:hypothetical protein